MLLHQVIDLGANPSDDFSAPFRKPQLGSAVAEPRVFLRVEQPVDLVLQRRDPIGILFVNFPREIDECLAVGLGFDRADGERLVHLGA